MQIFLQSMHDFILPLHKNELLVHEFELPLHKIILELYLYYTY